MLSLRHLEGSSKNGNAIDLKVHHVHELQINSDVDGIAQLASAFMTFYGISSTNATADPMVKYHLFNAIAHKDYDTLFLSTGVSRRSSSTARQTDNIFFKLDTLVLKNHMNIQKLMICEISTSHLKEFVFLPTQQIAITAPS